MRYWILALFILPMGGEAKVRLDQVGDHYLECDARLYAGPPEVQVQALGTDYKGLTEEFGLAYDVKSGNLSAIENKRFLISARGAIQYFDLVGFFELGGSDFALAFSFGETVRIGSTKSKFTNVFASIVYFDPGALSKEDPSDSETKPAYGKRVAGTRVGMVGVEKRYVPGGYIELHQPLDNNFYLSGGLTDGRWVNVVCRPRKKIH